MKDRDLPIDPETNTVPMALHYFGHACAIPRKASH